MKTRKTKIFASFCSLIFVKFAQLLLDMINIDAYLFVRKGELGLFAASESYAILMLYSRTNITLLSLS